MGKKMVVQVLDNVQEIFDLLQERKLKVEDRVKAEAAIKKIDEKLDFARVSLREHVDDRIGELYIDMDGEIFKISARDDRDVIIEPVHIDFRRGGTKS